MAGSLLPIAKPRKTKRNKYLKLIRWHLPNKSPEAVNVRVSVLMTPIAERDKFVWRIFPGMRAWSVVAVVDLVRFLILDRATAQALITITLKHIFSQLKPARVLQLVLIRHRKPPLEAGSVSRRLYPTKEKQRQPRRVSAVLLRATKE
jgi:hypothetical protein